MTYTQEQIDSVTTERLVDLIDNQAWTIFHTKEMGEDLTADYALYGQYIYELEKRTQSNTVFDL